MTPEQRAKIQALRKGEQYVPPVEPVRVRHMPKSIERIKFDKLFKNLFDKNNK